VPDADVTWLPAGRVLLGLGLLVVDDFTPSTTWPPRYAGPIDTPRQHWMDHPDLRATQVNVTPESSTIVATSFR
jgi:hypothetical protein